MANYPEKIGRYEVESLLGRGGMGEVYKAQDKTLDRFVALKIMRSAALDETNARERFIREAQAAGGLRHPNIVTIYDLGEFENQMYIAMEFIHGRDLEHLIKEKSPLALDDKFNIMIQVCEGVAFAHRNQVIHRDLKPSNIRIDDQGIVKIMDFGIAKLETSNMTASGTVLGTPFYMSPELIRGTRVDPRSDIFALGSILYEVLTYEKPFAGDMPSVFYKIINEQPAPLSEWMEISTAPLQAIIDRCLEKDKTKRLQTASELADLLREAQQKYRDMQVSTMSGMKTIVVDPNLRIAAPPAAVSTTSKNSRPKIPMFPGSDQPTVLNQDPVSDTPTRYDPPSPTETPSESLPLNVKSPAHLESKVSVPVNEIPPQVITPGTSGIKIFAFLVTAVIVFAASAAGLYYFVVRPNQNKTEITVPGESEKKEELPSQQRQFSGSFDDQLVRAKELHKSGKYSEAIQIYNSLLQQKSSDANLHYLLGAALQKSGQEKEALKEFRTAVQLDPKQDQAWEQIGYIQTSANEYKEAEDAFQKALALRPNSGSALAGLAQVYILTKQLDRAEESYKKLLDVEPNNVQAIFNLGFIESTRNNMPAAQNYFEKVIALDPNYAEARNNLGLIYLYQGQIDKAIDENEAAVKLKPNLASAHYCLYLAYEKKQQLHKSGEHLKLFMELANDQDPELKKKLDAYLK
jgi:serine/threonine protein kinase/Flp pilus assembly protein TadD